MVRAGNVHVAHVFLLTKVSLQRFRARLAATTVVFFGHVAGKGSDTEGASPRFWHSHPFLDIVIVFDVYSVQEAATGMGLCKARVLVNEVGFSKFPTSTAVRANWPLCETPGPALRRLPATAEPAAPADAETAPASAVYRVIARGRLEEVVDSQISNVRRIATETQGVAVAHSLRQMYVEVAGVDRNFELLRKLLTFCPDLTELHVHLVWGDFSNALSQCRHLHGDVVTLGTFVFTSEVSVPIPYQPVLSSKFTNCATLFANVRHQRRPEDSWSCVELDHVPHVGLPSQVAVVVVISDSIGESFCLASHRKYWTNVRELCLLLLPLAPSSMFYPIVDAAYHDILRQFFSVALEHVVELNLTSFHFHPDLDLVAQLPEGTLKTLRAFSAPPCVFPSQSAVRRLLTVCSYLRELDVRIDRRGGQLRCVAYEPMRHNKIVEAAPDDATSVVRSGVARLTVCDVPAHVQLWFLECCQAAVKVRLIEWPVITKKQSYGYLRAGHRGNSAIHCLVL
ncbi:hypothetical protein HPB51_025881 [Rhipicephalus microplus]|uniref:Uncharacterized protein n=1 Tax=Rhipicephalus microplus TaxID=6941 RepID=A0A9J6FAE1_RHIMP|nr:hypothetical protein HPB51_025881 [Rhipicephalus microplus]